MTHPMPVESRDDLVKRLRDLAGETTLKCWEPRHGAWLSGLREAATRIESDAKRIAELEAERERLYETRRWTIDRDGADLLICEGNHHRSEECEFTRYIPAIAAERALAEETERCAAIVDAECQRILSKQSPADPLSMADTVNSNLRMMAAILPDVATAIRSGKPKEM